MTVGRGSAPGRPDRRRTRDTRRNRRGWESSSASYERRHRRALQVAGGKSWGLYRVPERRLRLLGAVRGRSVLELGCGSATWSVALAREGAEATAMDFSRSRLLQARENVRRARAPVRLLEANAERLPFRAGVFDLVFCDWGAMTFAEPARTVPEVARVLRDEGRFVFASSSPFRMVTQRRPNGRLGKTLRYDYFPLGRIVFREGTEHTRSYSAWIRLFRENGLEIERLEEIPAPPGPPSTYLSRRDMAWGRRWPLESIWALRKPPGSGARRLRRARRGAGSGT